MASLPAGLLAGWLAGQLALLLIDHNVNYLVLLTFVMVSYFTFTKSVQIHVYFEHNYYFY